jgi:hypothetical protein
MKESIDVTRDFRFGHDIITYTNIGHLCHIDLYLFLFVQLQIIHEYSVRNQK